MSKVKTYLVGRYKGNKYSVEFSRVPNCELYKMTSKKTGGRMAILKGKDYFTKAVLDDLVMALKAFDAKLPVGGYDYLVSLDVSDNITMHCCITDRIVRIPNSKHENFKDFANEVLESFNLTTTKQAYMLNQLKLELVTLVDRIDGASVTIDVSIARILASYKELCKAKNTKSIIDKVLVKHLRNKLKRSFKKEH